ncbi:hypothetical protein [Halocatena halophila]|uniref:hypothetical protein n=1 Tax=Halocatena halophila TaxID=2814576 RepID=UPI002ED56183
MIELREVSRPCSRSPFCGNSAGYVVPAPNGRLYPICEECYQSPCGRCRGNIDKDGNVAKGLCQSCRDGIRSRETGPEKRDPGQTTLSDLMC